MAPYSGKTIKISIFENARWRQPPSGKSQKSRYLRNGLTDLYEIWYADAKWVSQLLRPLKILNFRNPIWRAADIWKTIKLPYICNRLTAHWHLTADRPLKFRLFGNLKWRRPPSSKSQKLRYLRNGLTDLYEIWYAWAK